MQNQNHTLINRAYCIDNPQDFVGYSEDCWGLTASDNQNGYSAHSPTNDLGVITPTAAIASIPYTPEYSLDAIRFFIIPLVIKFGESMDLRMLLMQRKVGLPLPIWQLIKVL